MGRKVVWPPTRHWNKLTNRDRIRLNGRWHDLGPHGSSEAIQEYARVLREVETRGGVVERKPEGLTVARLGALFLESCTAQDPQTRHAWKRAVEGAVALYGHTPAAEFAGPELRAVLAGWAREGCCRGYCNKLAGILRKAWRWAAGEKLLPAAAAETLGCVEGLRAGAARETEPVDAVDRAVVLATLPHLRVPTAGMVRLQLLTGCRPGEACAMTAEDILRPWRTVEGVELWLYALGSRHKTAWRGHRRDIPLGPEAQALLAPFLLRHPEGFLFCPREAGGRGERYSVRCYEQAITRACDRARVERWSPNQLRHLAGTEVGTAGDREDAQAFLGHERESMTARYHKRLERAAKLAAARG